VLEELSRQTRVLYRDHDDDQHDDEQHEYDESSGVPEEDSEHDVEEVLQQRKKGRKVGSIPRKGSVVDPLVEMAEEVVDGDADDVFRASELA